MIIAELKGHSGCKIYLCEQKNKKFVRKISKTEEYNYRLKKQAEKQDNFIDQILKTPKIINDGKTNGLYYFDMEYINGMNFNRYISTNTVESIDTIIDKIFSYFKNVVTTNRDYDLEISKKINKIEQVVPIDITKYKIFCLDHDWSNISSGVCHGDLTFENIIIYKSEPYLIDFLDSFINTTYIDISKMMQDTILLWSWRQATSVPIIKNIYIQNRISSFINPKEHQIVNRLLVLNLLRILPYCDKKTCKMIENRLEYILKRFKEC